MKNSKGTLYISQDFHNDNKAFHATYIGDADATEVAEHLAHDKTSAQATLEALALWGLEAGDVDVIYDPSCHFLCGDKCLVPGGRDDECPDSATSVPARLR